MGQPMNDQDETVSRAELVALQAEYDRKLAALTASLTRAPRPRPLRRRLLLLLPLVVLLALVPVSIRAANPFNDLTGGVHDPNIDLIYNAGITTGCVPNVSYCPTDNVTREQMASFLARTAGLGTNPPIVNAKTAQTATNATTATTATTAANATTVGGYAPNGLIRAAQKTSASVRDQSSDPNRPSEFKVLSIYNNTATPDPLASVSITAPGVGFVIVNATVNISIEPSSTGSSSLGTVGFVRLRDTSAGSAGTASPFLSTATGAGSQATTLGPTYVFPATAGAHSYVLEVQKSGTGIVRAFDGVVTALFVPFGSSGAGTLEGAQP